MPHDIFLHSFHSVLPEQCTPQSALNEWTVAAHMKAQSFMKTSPETERLIPLLKKFCVSDRLISQRYHECNDVNQEWESHEVYAIGEATPLGADILNRNLFFATKAKSVFNEFYQQSLIPEHLIHVTCTGYVAPSPAQVYFSDKTKVPAITHAYHMGCYASLPSVRMAQALAVNGAVDIVHTEMCSLHLNLGNHSPEQMVVQTLFADGHMKYTASLERRGPSFKILRVEERLVKDSLSDMTWVPGPNGMVMTLSREVPAKIQKGICDFMKDLCDRAHVDLKAVMEKAIFAIHPGGPKIIDAIQATLSLSDEQVSSSRKILLERGNMSSATLPHVWQNILRADKEKGTLVVSLAFGPGLTMFGGLFEVA